MSAGTRRMRRLEGEARCGSEAGQIRRAGIERRAARQRGADAGHDLALAHRLSAGTIDRHEPAAVEELRLDRRRDLRNRAGDKDDVVGRARGVAAFERPLDELDIAGAERAPYDVI